LRQARCEQCGFEPERSGQSATDTNHLHHKVTPAHFAGLVIVDELVEQVALKLIHRFLLVSGEF